MSRKDKKNFSAKELDLLLTLVEDKLPYGQEEWENLALEYNRLLQQQTNNPYTRNAESLRTKFKHLKNKQKPTGDPNCPIEVIRAKRAYKNIERRMDTTYLDDDITEEDENCEAIDKNGNEDLLDIEENANVMHCDSPEKLVTTRNVESGKVISNIAAENNSSSNNTGKIDKEIITLVDSDFSRSSTEPLAITKKDHKKSATGLKRVGCNMGSRVAVTMPSDATIRRSNLDRMIAKMIEREEAAAAEEKEERKVLFSLLDRFQVIQASRHEDIVRFLGSKENQKETITDVENVPASKVNIMTDLESPIINETVKNSRKPALNKKRIIEIDDAEYKALLALKRSKK